MTQDPLKRLGPLERTIRTKDAQAFLEEIERRCLKDLGTGCWIWTGACRSEGYPYIGRSRSQHLAHRVVWRAKTGFVYENHEVAAIHHACGVRKCLNPNHLSPATSFENAGEMHARKALLHRVEVLTEALRAIAPDHSLLKNEWSGTVDGLVWFANLAQGPSSSDRLRARQHLSKSAYQMRLETNRNARYRQVLDVEKLRSRGVPLMDALGQVGIGKSMFYDWKAQLRRKLDESA